jgi:hypothetical protein
MLQQSEGVVMAKKKTSAPATAGPGMEGRFEIGERLYVDPHVPGRPERKQVNVRESAVAHMASRGRLSSSHVAAADRFRELWERVSIGRSRALDIGNVGGGGGRGDPLSDSLVNAGAVLAQTMRQIGMIHGRFLIAIVGEGKTIAEVARTWSESTGRLKGTSAQGYVTGTLVDALDSLVGIWRLEAKGSPKRARATYKRAGQDVRVKDAIRASGPIEVAGPVNEISIGKFGDVEIKNSRPLDNSQLTAHLSGNLGGVAQKRRKRR